VVIVDDLVQTGGTLAEAAKVLRGEVLKGKGEGAKSVSAFCTHGVFPNNIFERFIDGEDAKAFENFWITNSIPSVSSQLINKGPFKVIDLAPLYHKILKERMEMN